MFPLQKYKNTAVYICTFFHKSSLLYIFSTNIFANSKINAYICTENDYQMLT